MSPSTRREWIEILRQQPQMFCLLSPTTRREWIEMTDEGKLCFETEVSLHTEGVD